MFEKNGLWYTFWYKCEKTAYAGIRSANCRITKFYEGGKIWTKNPFSKKR